MQHRRTAAWREETHTAEETYAYAKQLNVKVMNLLTAFEGQGAKPSVSDVASACNALSRVVCALEDKIKGTGHRVSPSVLAGARSLREQCDEARLTLDGHMKEEHERAEQKGWKEKMEYEKKRRELGLDIHGDESHIRIDNLYKENESFQRSNQMASQLEQLGVGIIDTLIHQQSILQRTRQSILSFSEQMGIHQQLMRMIHKRETVDRVLVYGGMVLFTLLLFFLFFYYKD